MHRLGLALLLLPALLAARPAEPPQASDPFDRLRSEAAAAQDEARRLEIAAGRSRNTATALGLRQAAAAAAVAAAEARISAADLDRKRIAALLERRRARLAEQQRPNAQLVAALVTMGRRPPLLTIAEQGSTNQFVEVRLLLDSTLPAIRQRTAALAAEIARGERLSRRLARAHQALSGESKQLERARARFVALEQRALGDASLLLGRSLEAGDVALARGEDVVRLGDDRSTRRAAARLGRELALLPEPPPRPFPPTSAAAPAPLAYLLPVNGRLVDGLGEISPIGIHSRGLVLAVRRGAQVVVPADGRIAFAGPFRSRDGVVIIDHGGGWMSLLTGVGADVAVGTRVRRGQPLGRALGEVGIELSHNGRPVSAALIAGSSPSLSNSTKAG